MGVRQFIIPIESHLFIQVAFTVLKGLLFEPIAIDTDDGGKEMVDVETMAMFIAMHFHQQRDLVMEWDTETRIEWYKVSKVLEKAKQEQIKALGPLASMM